MVEQQSHTLKVGSSTLPPGTIFKWTITWTRTVAWCSPPSICSGVDTAVTMVADIAPGKTMADFCRQCSLTILGIPDDEYTKDLSGLTTPEETERGAYAAVICEGCGFVSVDHSGRCIGTIEFDSSGVPHRRPCSRQHILTGP